ncbi:MAG TPA: metallophosphoesterase [Acidobacteriota bacterium]|nr:metallophosphoesterase [Acidobacteriota bacterium]
MLERHDSQGVHRLSSQRPRALGGASTLLVLIGLLLAANLVAADRESPRVVAVADVHGNLDNFLQILREAGIVDVQGNWAGGTDIFVQTGDLVDRGPDDRAVLDLIMKLEKQSHAAGGRVVSLLGNHEGMNVLGDLRYVDVEAYAAFADEDSAKRQEDYLKKLMKFQKRRAKKLGQPEPQWDAAAKALWKAKYPAGFVEHREAFSEKGHYGKWLRERPALALVEGVLFLHAGVSPQLAQLSLDEINKRVRNELKAYDSYRKTLVGQDVILEYYTVQEMIAAVRNEFEYQSQRDPSQIMSRAFNPDMALSRHRQYVDLLRGVLGYSSWLVNSPIGPLWFRGYAKWEDQDGLQTMPEIAGRFKAKAVVVGHTPQLKSGIRARFEGRVLLIDTGLNNAYYKGGAPSALEIVDDTFTALYSDGRRETLISQAAAASTAQSR